MKPDGGGDGAPQHGQLLTASIIPALVRAIVLVLAVLVFNPQPIVLPLASAFEAARLAALNQDYAAQADALANAAARLPYVGPVVYRAGLAEISAGRFDAAIRHIRGAASLDGWTPAARIAVGDAYLGLGQIDNALAEWEMALAYLPEDEALLARMAAQYERAGRYDEAIEMLARLARVRGSDADTYLRLALLTSAVHPLDALSRLAVVDDLAPQHAAVAAILRTAIEEGRAVGDPAYLYARVGFACVQLGEWALAELALGQAVTINPEYAEAHTYLGLAQERQGRDGLASYEAALALNPDSPLVRYFLGLYWRRTGDFEAALAHLTAAHDLDPTNPALAAEIGAVYASLGDLLQAEHWLVNAVRMDQQNPAFWLLLARLYIEHEFNLADGGMPAARMAVGLDPNSAAAHDALGHGLALTGDPVNAQKMLERALALDPDLASAHYHMGLLQIQLGETALAQASLQRALVLDPEGPYGGLAIRALAQISP